MKAYELFGFDEDPPEWAWWFLICLKVAHTPDGLRVLLDGNRFNLRRMSTNEWVRLFKDLGVLP